MILQAENAKLREGSGPGFEDIVGTLQMSHEKNTLLLSIILVG